ncbi:MAG: glycoside hydrolase family 127 protein [Thermoguttaceae bacterium]|nr:glycoside hydrolase family 127 protein [Thermoguttaceae bacterium]
MKNRVDFSPVLAPLALICFFFFTAVRAADTRDVVTPAVPDKLESVILDHEELGGEIDRRIIDLVYHNYMVLDFENDWLRHFRERIPLPEDHPIFIAYYGVGKVIDAGSLLGAYTKDDAVRARTKGLLDGILATRDDDGYIGFLNREPEDKQNFFNYILHEQEYFALACVRHYRVTGEERSLCAARVMIDYIMKTFPKNDAGVYCIPSPVSIAGLAEAAEELYRVTAEEKYLDFAEHVQYEPHWYYEPAEEWLRHIDSRRFHLYVMFSHMYPETELYRLTGEDGRLIKARWMYAALLEKQYGGLFVTGSASSGEYFTRDQVGTGAAEESCVTAYLLRLFDSLLRIDGDLRIGDVMERTIYNALFAAQSPDGRRLRYFTPFSGPRWYYQPDTFCCPGNFRRAVAELPRKVCYTFDGGLAINLYAPMKKTLTLGGVPTLVEEITDYPNSGEVKFVLTPPAAAEFTLRLRLPRWAEMVSVAVNDEPEAELLPGDYPGGYDIKRTWNPGDTVVCSMPMTWRFVRGHAAQSGRAALLRGPVLFCFSAAQNEGVLPEGFPPRDLVIDPDTLTDPVEDDSVRPNGMKTTARVRLGDGGEEATVTLTEFVDPSGIEVYFRVKEDAALQPVEDELFDQRPMTTPVKLVGALYGPPAQTAEEGGSAIGEPIADLAADYRPPIGGNQSARFAAPGGQWSVWISNSPDLDQASEKHLLSSNQKVYGTPDGFAYGSGSPDGLGFLANHDPSPRQSGQWRQNYTEGLFDQMIPPALRDRFVFTHPVDDPGKYIVFRFLPDESFAETPLIASAAVCRNPAGNGVTLDLLARSPRFFQEDAPQRTVYRLNGGNDGLISTGRATAAGSGPIDFVLGNNGDYSCDATAIALTVRPILPFVPGEGQIDVTKILAPRMTGKTCFSIGSYNETFGDPAPGMKKNLKLMLFDPRTGEVTLKELEEDQPIELE